MHFPSSILFLLGAMSQSALGHDGHTGIKEEILCKSHGFAVRDAPGLDSSLTLVNLSYHHLSDSAVSWNSASLPYPVSDMTATYTQGQDGDEDGFVMLVGGCDSLKGNERVNFDGEDLFACLSTTNRTLKFDPFENKFEQVADAPHVRQRHGAAAIQGEIYVVGGRDTDDALVSAIDAYNPQTDTWRTVGNLPEGVVTSDLAAWSWENKYLYVAGGYLNDYTSVGETFRIDVTADELALDSDGFLATEQLTASPNPRGDFQAVVLYGYAYLAGGITHTSQWCEALKTTERYHMKTDTWETLVDLSVGRADMAVANLNGKIVAIGGETKPDDCKDVEDPAYGSFPASEIDVMTHGDYPKWIEYEHFTDERFRFAAAGVPALNKIFTFGGQLPYDFTCDCFATSDDVAVGLEDYQEGDDGMSTGGIVGLVIALAFGALCGCFVAKKCCNQKEPVTENKELQDASGGFEDTKVEGTAS